MDKRVALKIAFILATIFFAIIVFAQPITAKPPTDTIINFPTGYVIIESPHQETQVLVSNQYNFFVYNDSTGETMDNSTINCTFFLANKTGEILFAKDVPYFSDGHWGIDILGGNFSYVGIYPYGLNCQGTGAGGAIANYFEATYLGNTLSEAQAILYGFFFFIFLFFMFALTFVINSLPTANAKDEEGKILSISYLKYLRSALWFTQYILFVGLLYLASNVAFAYMPDEMFATVLFALFTIVFRLAPIVVILWVIWMFVKMFHDKQLQKLLNRGIFPQGRL